MNFEDSPYNLGPIHPLPYLRFKTQELFEQWCSGRFHPALYIKIDMAAYLYFQLTSLAIVITSLWRPDGIHSYFRAGDLRTRNSAVGLEQWSFSINRLFPYHGKAGCQTSLIHQVKKCLSCKEYYEMELVICPNCQSGDYKLMGSHNHIQVGPREPLPKVPTSYIAG